MPTRRQKKLAEELSHRAGEFIARESNHRSLITVTRSEVSPDFKKVTVFVSVLPKEAETDAIGFLKRVRTDFHDFLKEKTVLGNVPTVDFVLDIGEENRQRVDDVLREKK